MSQVFADNKIVLSANIKLVYVHIYGIHIYLWACLRCRWCCFINSVCAQLWDWDISHINLSFHILRDKWDIHLKASQDNLAKIKKIKWISDRNIFPLYERLLDPRQIRNPWLWLRVSIMCLFSLIWGCQLYCILRNL